MIELKVGNKYSFETYCGAILNTKYTAVTLISTMTYALARKLSSIDNIHAAVLPNLPANSPTDPSSYNYYIFEDSLKNQICLSSGWIKTDSITEVSEIEFNIQVFGNSIADIEKARKALILAGLSNFKITNK